MAATGFAILEQAGLSDVGVRRSHNQDAFTILATEELEIWRERGHLLLVADGMGAHAVGELASKRAADLIPHAYQKYAPQGAPTALSRAFQEANGTIYQQGQQNPEFEGMGTTTSALVLRPEGAWTGHVGDSRIYRIRAGYIEQISFDHSLQWELARRQGVDPSQVEGIPSNVIVRSLGPEPMVQVDIEGPHPILPGDVYLLCSDGLSNQLNDTELGCVISALPLKEACQLLVDLANLRGGPDNITLVLVRLPGQSPPSGTDIELIPRVGRVRSVLFRKLPWSGMALGAGIMLAFVALVLIIGKWHKEGIVTFLLAGSALVVGLLGLRQTLAKEKRQGRASTHMPPRVYRRSPCRIDQGIVDKVQQVEKTLYEYAQKNGWRVDWSEHETHLGHVKRAIDQGDLISAFREQCRALAQLTEALRQHRNKEETFRPLW